MRTDADDGELDVPPVLVPDDVFRGLEQVFDAFLLPDDADISDQVRKFPASPGSGLAGGIAAMSGPFLTTMTSSAFMPPRSIAIFL